MLWGPETKPWINITSGPAVIIGPWTHQDRSMLLLNRDKKLTIHEKEKMLLYPQSEVTML